MFKEKITTIKSLEQVIKNRFPKQVYYKVLRDKKPVGVFLHYYDFKNLLDNLSELSDRELVASIQEAREELARGEGMFLKDVVV